jgi:predicted AAA+ superfamily ATPase
MIPRISQHTVIDALSPWRIVILYGARQTGKTTILKSIESQIHKTMHYFNADTLEDRSRLDTTSLAALATVAQNTEYLLIDEAQRLTNPGLTLKILHDQFPKLHIVATGSASFELKNRISDALTGRAKTITLYPFSLPELTDFVAVAKAGIDPFVSDMLTYGSYPQVWLSKTHAEKVDRLNQIVDSYLFKDILQLETIRGSEPLSQLVRAVAYQIGNLVNESELAVCLKIDRKTVNRYLTILEQLFIITRVYPYAKNPRREIGKQYKLYFTDLGIRNALIGDFNIPSIRNDLGALWENWCAIERLKQAYNAGNTVKPMFWRTYNGAEVDWLELTAQGIRAYEMKYGEKYARKSATSFTRLYNIPVTTITWNSYLSTLYS